MVENLKTATFEQIATLLSQLANNYTSLMDSYYDMFFNTNPINLKLPMYTADGTLKVVTVPNRAADLQYLKNGSGSPEGAVQAPKGTIYQDILNGEAYIKELGTGFTGWTKLGGDVYIIRGSGSPEGRVLGTLGSIYEDATNAVLYIKKTSTGNTGWDSIVSGGALRVTYDL